MVQPASKPKRTSFEEVARVLRIAQAIDEELRRIAPLMPSGTPQGLIVGPDTTITYAGAGWDILAVADRIAARTEE